MDLLSLSTLAYLVTGSVSGALVGFAWVAYMDKVRPVSRDYRYRDIVIIPCTGLGFLAGLVCAGSAVYGVGPTSIVVGVLMTVGALASYL
jgi:hypothetical protein